MNVVIIGASGAIGSALLDALAARAGVDRLYAICRSGSGINRPPASTTLLSMDLTCEREIEAAAAQCAQSGPLHMVIVATGLLHDGATLAPEKSWSAIDADGLHRLFMVNTIGPTLVAKHFLPLLDRHNRSVFAALSARVGSISDNRLGGWYGYRASKAALNMIIKTLSIELRRKNPTAICIGLHPGTVDSALSKPFQGNVENKKLFSATQSAQYLLQVLDAATPEQSGRVLAWNGDEIDA